MFRLWIQFLDALLKLFARRLIVIATVLLALGAAGARVRAATIYDPNGKPELATVLTQGQFIVNDSLSADTGRPDTLLGLYDPAYKTLMASDDNSSPIGNGLASQLIGVPLRSNGSAYFRVTGAADTNFNGSHNQTGRYYVRFDLYDAQHNFFKSIPLIYENVAPGMVDNIWLDPPSDFEPERVGGTVDVTVNNIVGPGTGDAVDFFIFSGMQPNQPFLATLTAATFNPLLGLFGGPNNTLLASSTPGDEMPTIAGVADAQGRALLAVTGVPDAEFKGVHAEVGDYTLVVLPEIVPEPASVALLGCGGALAAAWLGLRHRGRRGRQ